MKCRSRSSGFVMKLGMTAAVMMFAQHALAAGTAAGTDVDNMATVAYDVGGAAQTVIESAPGVGNSAPGAGLGTLTSFEVDNRVDFSVTQVGTANTIVAPAENDAFVEFTLSNDGNSPQDFRLVALQLVSGDGAVNGDVDTDVNVNNVRIRVGNGGGVPVLGDLDYVDELAPDTAVTVYVFADADATFVNLDVANLELTATVAEAGAATTLGVDVVDDIGDADDPAQIDIVFADGVVTPPGLGDGIESDRDGFTVSAAGLVISKVARIISDPFNDTTNPKAIPGAIIEYVITVTNPAGGADADNIVITDAIDADVTYITDFYASQDVEIDNNGAIEPLCNTDTGDGDGDGCALNGVTLTIGDPTDLPLTVVSGTFMTVTYRVTIP